MPFDFYIRPEILSAIIGAISGGFFGATVPILLTVVEDNRKRRRIKRAIAAEIRAMISATSRAGLSDFVSEIGTRISAGEELQVPTLFYDSMSYDPIFASNMENIGLIEVDLAQQITGFYRTVRLARFRFIAFQGQKIGDDNRENFLRALAILQRAILDLDEAKTLAHKLEK